MINITLDETINFMIIARKTDLVRLFFILTKQIIKIAELLTDGVKKKVIIRKLIDLKLIDKNVTPASFAGKIHRIKEKLNLTQTKTSLKYIDANMFK